MKKGEIYLVIYMFFFLFAPPFIPKINITFILALYSFLLIIIKYLKKLKILFSKKEFKKIILLLILYNVLYLFSYSINTIIDNANYFSNYVINCYSFVLNFIMTIICAIYFVFKIDELQFNIIDVIRVIIEAGLIQLILCICSLINPNFKQWTLDKMIKDSNKKLLSTPWILERRFYGFSNNLLDLFGFGMGIIAFLPIVQAELTQKKHLIILTPLLIITSFLNARTGIVILIIGILLYAIYKLINKKINPIKIFIVGIIIFIVLIAMYRLIYTYSYNTISWVINDFLSFTEESNNIGTADQLFSNTFWTLPEPSKLLFGAGHSVSGYNENIIKNITNDSINTTKYIRSDVGYINEIWKIGLVGCFIYLYIHHYMIKCMKKNESNKVLRLLFDFFEISILVFMIKGSTMGYNPGNVIIYTMAIIYVYNEKKEKIINE